MSRSVWARVRRLAVRCAFWAVSIPVAALAVLTGLLAVADPPFTAGMAAHYLKSGPFTHESVDIGSLPRHLPLAFVAAEDSEFCRHWGFDVGAIRSSSKGGGASISQQTARSLFLWQGESGLLRILESVATGTMELVLSKRRIVEIYLSINDYGGGIYGVAAAAESSFGKAAAELDEEESALLAARFGSGETSTAKLEQRAKKILEGARLLSDDSRSACIDG